MWLWLFISLIAGLGLARKNISLDGFSILILLPFLVLSLRQRALLCLVLVITSGLAGGLWRGHIYMHKIGEYEPIYYKKITVSARAMEDGTYGKTKQLTFTASNIILENGSRLVGKIQLSGFGVNAVFQDDEIIATGKLYPTRGAAQARMSFAVLQVTSHHPSAITQIKRRFVAGMQSALPEPLAPFAMGLLVGQRANLPDDIKQNLQMVGLTHIIAVSGYNLTIIVQAGRRLLGKKSKRISTFLILSLICIFLLLAGFSAPIVRAAIVSSLSMAAAYYGRSFKPLNLICLAAAVTAFANPIYLWSDLSWYLSFLGFFGVMILAPLVHARWGRRWADSLVGGVALESLCAEAMTLPFILYIFGQMSRVGLIANVLVVTLVPLAMLLGLVSSLVGMFAASLAGWLAWPCVLLLNYMLDTARLLAGLPNIFVEGIGLTLTQMLFLYGCVVIIISILWYKNPQKSAIITDMNEPRTRGLLA